MSLWRNHLKGSETTSSLGLEVFNSGKAGVQRSSRYLLAQCSGPELWSSYTLCLVPGEGTELKHLVQSPGAPITW